MRAIKISVPKDLSSDVVDLVLGHGASGAVVHSVDHFDAAGKRSDKVVVDIETSTPKAKAITDALMAASFFDTSICSVSTRQPRAIVSDDSYADITEPWVEPSIDVFQELWQFTHITSGFILRILIGGALLAYGIINQEILMMIAGMLFLPLVPVLMGIGMGIWAWHPGLVGRAGGAMLLAVALLVGSGVAVAMVSHPPLMYTQFNSMLTSVVISLAVGVAAALASTDDGGRRELIGLAAAAQVAVKSVWLGAALVLGTPVEAGSSRMTTEAVTLAINIISIIGASLATYVAVGVMNGHKKHQHARPVSTGIQSASRSKG